MGSTQLDHSATQLRHGTSLALPSSRFYPGLGTGSRYSSGIAQASSVERRALYIFKCAAAVRTTIVPRRSASSSIASIWLRDEAHKPTSPLH